MAITNYKFVIKTKQITNQGYYKQGYYIKVYQGYYVTMTLTNHRTFQNRSTLDAKKCTFAHRRVVRVGYSESAR